MNTSKTLPEIYFDFMKHILYIVTNELKIKFSGTLYGSFLRKLINPTNLSELIDSDIDISIGNVNDSKKDKIILEIIRVLTINNIEILQIHKPYYNGVSCTMLNINTTFNNVKVSTKIDITYRNFPFIPDYNINNLCLSLRSLRKFLQRYNCNWDPEKIKKLSQEIAYTGNKECIFDDIMNKNFYIMPIICDNCGHISVKREGLLFARKEKLLKKGYHIYEQLQSEHLCKCYHEHQNSLISQESSEDNENFDTQTKNITITFKNIPFLNFNFFKKRKH